MGEVYRGLEEFTEDEYDLQGQSPSEIMRKELLPTLKMFIGAYPTQEIFELLRVGDFCANTLIELSPMVKSSAGLCVSSSYRCTLDRS